MYLLRVLSFPAAAALVPGVAVANPFGDRERSSLSNVGGVLERMQQAVGDPNPDEQRMMLVGVGAVLMLLFLTFAALRSSR
jgi:hypothetical protein